MQAIAESWLIPLRCNFVHATFVPVSGIFLCARTHLSKLGTGIGVGHDGLVPERHTLFPGRLA